MKSFFQSLLTEDVLTKGLSRYSAVSADATELGAFENIVYKVKKPNNFIVRFTHSTHRSASDIQAELEFMDYLFENGVSIPMPRKSKDGSFCEEIEASDGSSFCLGICRSPRQKANKG